MRRGAPARRPVSTIPPGSHGTASEQAALRAWVRILAVHKRALALIRDDLEHEMTLPRFDLLSNLARRDGQTLASLSRTMLVTAGNITGLVDRAARDGMVQRLADPTDRRAWRVHITPKGERAFREAERRHAARVAKLFSVLSQAELLTLLRALDKLRHSLREVDIVAPRRRITAANRSYPERKGTRRRARPKVEDKP